MNTLLVLRVMMVLAVLVVLSLRHTPHSSLLNMSDLTAGVLMGPRLWHTTPGHTQSHPPAPTNTLHQDGANTKHHLDNTNITESIQIERPHDNHHCAVPSLQDPGQSISLIQYNVE